jgi:ketosteroid isomerase-like protein
MNDNRHPTPVSALLGGWKRAFEERNVEGLVALYADECFLFGGKPPLFAGLDDIRAYFDGLPAARLLVEFEEQSIWQVAATVIATAGFVAFRRVDGPISRYRITLTLVLADGAWKIVSHHASPVPA